MNGQSTFRRETLSAKLTDVWFLPSVYSSMNTQGRSLIEAFPAIFASERLFSRMYTNVLVQEFLGSEALFAEITTERFKPGVCPVMQDQLGIGRETFTTLIAHVRFQLQIVFDTNMILQCRFLSEHLSTNRALIFQICASNHCAMIRYLVFQ